MSVTTEMLLDQFNRHQWEYTDETTGEVYEFAVEILPRTLERYDSIDRVVADLDIDDRLPDPRTEWHRRFTPLEPWVRAYLVMQLHDWNAEQAVSDFHYANPHILRVRLLRAVWRQRPDQS